ncbi:hypothetical protein GGG87_00355 [Streptococcus sp. zg-86]|uniref:Uncharacterized protein n=1 Tax=Streptococcus zhangguiae TaxID=2664091 RepID=A0A6I4RA73_9STRE|nr:MULTISPECIES: hypothetical protein [unclassified Streptococcus]MTB63464.1 hypothetical protein [Streptococcus sp. zg-86]MTB89887.1 hypothetical protein [Streptococcus sp. zg-36]MWV55558.1 hypothetical protein [Streptococcus sp. zg-70]QTH47748.1 hypothetical protein J5M87_09485 [Streptococcus sp. zg-86]
MKKLSSLVLVIACVFATRDISTTSIKADEPDFSNSTIAHSNHTHLHRLTRDDQFGPITVRLTIYVELYTNGSFRQINAIHNHYLEVFSTSSPQLRAKIPDDACVSVWSSTDFPSTTLLYAYNATLFSRLTSPNKKLQKELDDAHFHKIERQLYRRSINQNGRFKLY